MCIHIVKSLFLQVHALECPICLESAAPPVSQCVHGHILCVVCRPKTTRCPICRVVLGQGRCLLADKLHRVLCDTFNVNNDETIDKTPVASNRCNLRVQLLGKDGKREETAGPAKPRQFLLTRLLLGGREKAASVDNLTRVSDMSERAAVNSAGGATNANRLHVQLLSLNDRTKSASTGELSRNSETRIHDSSSQIAAELSTMNTSQQSQTPIWGGSTDSMSSVQLACPFLQSCREVTTVDSLLEHIKTHAVPQIHFYSRSAKIPLPLPFGCDALYIFHHGSDIFFFQVCDIFRSTIYLFFLFIFNTSLHFKSLKLEDRIWLTSNSIDYHHFNHTYISIKFSSSFSVNYKRNVHYIFVKRTIMLIYVLFNSIMIQCNISLFNTFENIRTYFYKLYM